MGRTGSEVTGDLLALLKASPLASMIDGGIYRAGLRPRDSRKEDLVVIFTTGIHGDIDKGIVTLNLYVPDLELEGVTVANGQRCEALERALYNWVSHLGAAQTPYLLRLKSVISTEPAPEIQQHFVAVKLEYRYFA